MTSEDIPGRWDFTEALNLLHGYTQPRYLEFKTDVPNNILSPDSSDSDSLNGSPTRRPTLGNFDRVFRKFNKPIYIEILETHRGSLDNASSILDDETSPSTTPLDCDAQQFDKQVTAKEVRWTDQVEIGANHIHKRKNGRASPINQEPSKASSLTNLISKDQAKLNKILRKSNHSKYLRQETAHSGRSNEDSVGGTSLFELEIVENEADCWLQNTPDEISHNVQQERSGLARMTLVSSVNQLLPACVTPIKAELEAWQSPAHLDSGTIRPLLYLTREEKEGRIIRRLKENYGRSFVQHVDLKGSSLQKDGNTTSDGIHVFVDSSNIAIGFYDALKIARGFPIRSYTKRVPLSFHSLALVMERGRNVAKRVLVGSSDRRGELPEYMIEAARCGYEINSLDRVEKFKESRSSGRKSRSGNGYGTSGQSSGSETSMPGAKKVTEQGVDEILHMKMLESLIDSKRPSTMVLATGDAAEAEYSSGFFKNVERALGKGWKVEVVAWGHSMSNAYRSPNFLKKWRGQFTAIDLDQFSEELLGVYVEQGHGPGWKFWGPGTAVRGAFDHYVQESLR